MQQFPFYSHSQTTQSILIPMGFLRENGKQHSQYRHVIYEAEDDVCNCTKHSTYDTKYNEIYLV